MGEMTYRFPSGISSKVRTLSKLGMNETIKIRFADRVKYDPIVRSWMINLGIYEVQTQSSNRHEKL